MESEASREFEMDIQRRYGKEGEPLFTKISIKDTAKVKGGELDLFNDFKPEKFPKEGYEYLYLGGFPAIVVNYKSKGIEAQFLINDRFILTIVLRGQPYKNLKNWFDLVKFPTLKNIPDGLKVSVPDEFTVIEIDELNSSKSRRYNSSASLPEVADEEIKAANSDEGADNKD